MTMIPFTNLHHLLMLVSLVSTGIEVEKAPFKSPDNKFNVQSRPSSELAAVLGLSGLVELDLVIQRPLARVGQHAFRLNQLLEPPHVEAPDVLLGDRMTVRMMILRFFPV